MKDDELLPLLDRIAAGRREVDGLLVDCGGDAALQERMAGLYLEIEDRRQAVEAARRAARPAPRGLAGLFAGLFGTPASSGAEVDSPAVRTAQEAMAESEAALESVNALFRKIRALREELRARLEVLIDSAARWEAWDAGTLRTRFEALDGPEPFRRFEAELPGRLYVELLAHAGRHLESLKTAGAQIDTLVRAVESSAATSGDISAPSFGLIGGLGRSSVGRESSGAPLRETLHRIQSRALPDLRTSVARAQAGLGLLGLARTESGRATDEELAGLPAAGSPEADVHRMRWQLLAFGREIQAIRSAAEAGLKALWAQRDRVRGAEAPAGALPPFVPGTEESVAPRPPEPSAATPPSDPGPAGEPRAPAPAGPPEAAAGHESAPARPSDSRQDREPGSPATSPGPELPPAASPVPPAEDPGTDSDAPPAGPPPAPTDPAGAAAPSPSPKPESPLLPEWGDPEI